MGNIMSV